MTNIAEYSTTAASNNDSPPNGAPEGMAPSAVNDTMREMMARMARMNKDTDGSLQSTGASNAYVLTTNSSFDALAKIALLRFRANFANTGAATINVDGLGAKSIQIQQGIDLAGGDIPENKVIDVVYNETDDYFQYINPPVGVPTGSVVAWPITSVPNGWLECDGSSVSRTTFANLFGVLGTTYGNVDGTTFNLPDYRGEFLRGRDGGAGNDPDAVSRTDRGDGQTGDKVGTKQGHEFEEHDHPDNISSSFPRRAFPNNQSADDDTARVCLALLDGNTGTFNADMAGGVQDRGGNETRPRNVYVKWIIKA